MEDDSTSNTIHSPAIECTNIIDQIVERTAEKRQQEMNQLTDHDFNFNVIDIVPQSATAGS